YALELLPEDSGQRREIENLVERNLSGGRIQLGIETKEGLRYSISRVSGEASIVLDDAGKPTEITLKLGGGFFPAAIFSQNEVEGLADCSKSQLAMLDTFEAEKIAAVEAQLRQVELDLKGNAASILPLRQA